MNPDGITMRLLAEELRQARARLALLEVRLAHAEQERDELRAALQDVLEEMIWLDDAPVLRYDPPAAAAEASP